MNTMLSRRGTFLCLGALLTLPVSRLSAAPPPSAFTLVSAKAETLTPAALASMQKLSATGRLPAVKRLLLLTRNAPPFLAVTGPDTDMLSYRIAGLRNPTLVVTHGATFTLLFANTDDDMFHNLRFGPAREHFPNVMATLLRPSVGTPPLAHQSKTAIQAERLILRAPAVPGTYAYFCTVRGHAQGGMAGQVIVR